MPEQTQNKDDRIIYLYRITCTINNKNYIGQTVDPTSRWRGHRRDSAYPKVPIQFAINKYGTHNFEFEIIASCKNQDDANELETLLVKQYDSFVSNNKGYNATHGGMNAPKSEAWVKAMKAWHASLTPEDRAEISRQQSEATQRQIAEKGHPAQGRIVTQEEKELHRKARLENPLEYTVELRQRMSEAHIGIKDTEETKNKKSESAKIAWEQRISYDGIKCNAPGCEVSGKAKYKIIEGIRYCNKHGLRLLRYGHLDRIKY